MANVQLMASPLPFQGLDGVFHSVKGHLPKLSHPFPFFFFSLHVFFQGVSPICNVLQEAPHLTSVPALSLWLARALSIKEMSIKEHQENGRNGGCKCGIAECVHNRVRRQCLLLLWVLEVCSIVNRPRAKGSPQTEVKEKHSYIHTTYTHIHDTFSISSMYCNRLFIKFLSKMF